MARILITGRLPGRVGAILEGHQVIAPAGDDKVLPSARVDAELGAAEALLPLVTHRVDAALLDRAPRLRLVANYGVGYDNIDVSEATRRGVVVTNTPDVLTSATADLTMALLLAAARRFGEGDELARSGTWRGWEPEQLLGLDLEGAVLGVVGFGRIGRAVAGRARAFGMRVLYAAPKPAPASIEAELAAQQVPFEALLAEADVVSLHCPLNAATRHLIDARALERMKPGAILINTARGPICDEAAVAAALERGRLAAVGLDVFEREPEIDARLRANRRAILTPHLGSGTRGARAGMAEIAAQSIADFFAGKRPAHVVNPAALSDALQR